MFVKTTNNQIDQYPYTIGNLRRDNPNTSFPKRPDDTLLAEWNVHRVAKTDRPTVDHTKNVAEGTPVLVNGTWTQVWETTDATAEEIAERTEQATKSVRSKRDQLLTETDWVVIKAKETGTTISAVWKTYRQVLRDITTHVNFPHLNDEDWPANPEEGVVDSDGTTTTA